MALNYPNIPLPGLGQRQPGSLAELLNPQIMALRQSAQLGLAPFEHQLKQAEAADIPLNRKVLEAKAQYAAPHEAAALRHLLAQTSVAEQEAKFMPQKYQIEAGNLSARQQELKYNTDPSVQFLKSFGKLPLSQRTSYLASNKEGVNTVVSHLDRLAQQSGQPAMSPQEKEKTKNDLVLNAQNQENMDVVKDPETRKMVDASIAYRQYLNDPRVVQAAVDASSYAGAAGKGKKALDAWTKNPENEEKYRNAQFFYEFMLNNQANFTRQIEGLRATNQTQKKLQQMYQYSLDQWSSNPERAIDSFYKTQQELASIEKSRSLTAQRKYPWVAENMIAPGMGEKFYDVPDFRKMAATGSKPIKTPSFKTKEEYQKWVKSLSPEDQRRHSQGLS